MTYYELEDEIFGGDGVLLKLRDEYGDEHLTYYGDDEDEWEEGEEWEDEEDEDWW